MNKRKINWRNLGILALVIVLAIQTVQISSIKGQITGVYDGNSQAINEVGQAREFITEFGSDLNEIRNLLLLPTKSYSFEEVEESIEEAEDTLFADVFTYISGLGNNIKYEENSTLLYDYFELEETEALLEENNFTSLQEGETYKILNESLTTIYKLYVDEEGNLVITNYFFESIEGLEEISTNYSEIKEEIDKFEEVRSGLYDILYGDEGEVHDALYAQGMWFEGQYEGEEAFEYYLVTQDQDRLATINLSKVGEPDKITWQNLVTDEMFPMEIDASEIAALINELDGRTSLEKEIDEAEEKLLDLLEDEAFLQALSDNSLTISQEARTEEFGIYFDIFDLDGNVLSTIYIDTRTGKVMVEADGVLQELLSAVADDDSSKKKLWICLKPFPHMKG